MLRNIQRLILFVKNVWHVLSKQCRNFVLRVLLYVYCVISDEKKEKSAFIENIECIICHDTILRESDLVYCLKCTNINGEASLNYHVHCLIEWITVSKNYACPVCTEWFPRNLLLV